MDDSEESDEFLVKQAIHKDKAAFAKLYNRYFAGIYRFARYQGMSRHDAEDLAGIVFLNAWKTIETFSFKHEASFRAWVFRIARNAIYDQRRRDYRYNAVSLDIVENDDILNDSAQPADELDARINALDLSNALKSLTNEQRDVVLLRYIEGFALSEIAEIMNKESNAIRGLKFRGLDALRRLLGPRTRGRHS